MQALGLAAWGAAAVAIAAALFGVGIARMVWAEDLRNAQSHLESARRIDEIRSQTEQSLRDHIATLERHVQILQH